MRLTLLAQIKPVGLLNSDATPYGCLVLVVAASGRVVLAAAGGPVVRSSLPVDV